MDKTLSTFSPLISSKSDFVFSLPITGRLLKPMLEGRVVSVDSVDGLYFCRLTVEPFGSKTLDFSESGYSPCVGEVFYISLDSWDSPSPSHDFVWPSAIIDEEVEHSHMYERSLSLSKFEFYNATPLFRLQTYFTSGLVFPKKREAKFCFPWTASQPLFLRKRRHLLLRGRLFGTVTATKLLMPLFPISQGALLRFFSFKLPNSISSSFFMYELCWRVCFLASAVPFFHPKKLRRKLWNGLSRLLKARQRHKVLSYSGLSPIMGLNYFQVSRSLFSLPLRTPFDLFLSSALASMDDSSARTYSTFMHYFGVSPSPSGRPMLPFYYPSVRSRPIVGAKPLFFAGSKRFLLALRSLKLRRLSLIRYSKFNKFNKYSKLNKGGSNFYNNNNSTNFKTFNKHSKPNTYNTYSKVNTYSKPSNYSKINNFSQHNKSSQAGNHSKGGQGIKDNKSTGFSKYSRFTKLNKAINFANFTTIKKASNLIKTDRVRGPHSHKVIKTSTVDKFVKKRRSRLLLKRPSR